MLDRFQVLEEAYWDLYRPVYLEQYINPLNIAEEKEQFFQAWKEGREYNPQFSYMPLNFNLEEKLAQFHNLKKTFEETPHCLSKYYVEHIENSIMALKHFAHRQSDTFVSWLTGQYGAPSDTSIEHAKKLLDNLGRVEKEVEELDAMALFEIFTELLTRRNFYGWQIVVEEMPARMSINQMTKTVKIKESAKFSKREVERLKVHEVDTHILRTENAQKQPYTLFRYGFPRYLQTEEGLAILSEEKNGLLSQYDKKKYAMRVLAASYACEHSFYELFAYLVKQMDGEDAFSMALRTKRGLQDTSLKGGYTKDQVYLAGYMMLKDEPLSVISKLYYGKIGLDDLEDLDGLDDLNDNIVYPEWLKG